MLHLYTARYWWCKLLFDIGTFYHSILTISSILVVPSVECGMRNLLNMWSIPYTVCGILLHWENPSAYWVNQSIWHDRMGIKISNNGGWVTIETHRQNLVENTKTWPKFVFFHWNLENSVHVGTWVQHTHTVCERTNTDIIWRRSKLPNLQVIWSGLLATEALNVHPTLRRLWGTAFKDIYLSI